MHPVDGDGPLPPRQHHRQRRAVRLAAKPRACRDPPCHPVADLPQEPPDLGPRCTRTDDVDHDDAADGIRDPGPAPRPPGRGGLGRCGDVRPRADQLQISPFPVDPDTVALVDARRPIVRSLTVRGPTLASASICGCIVHAEIRREQPVSGVRRGSVRGGSCGRSPLGGRLRHRPTGRRLDCGGSFRLGAGIERFVKIGQRLPPHAVQLRERRRQPTIAVVRSVGRPFLGDHRDVRDPTAGRLRATRRINAGRLVHHFDKVLDGAEERVRGRVGHLTDRLGGVDRPSGRTRHSAARDRRRDVSSGAASVTAARLWYTASIGTHGWRRPRNGTGFISRARSVDIHIRTRARAAVEPQASRVGPRRGHQRHINVEGISALRHDILSRRRRAVRPTTPTVACGRHRSGAPIHPAARRPRVGRPCIRQRVN